MLFGYFYNFKLTISKGNFAGGWEELGEENELSETFSLPMKTLEEAVKNIVLFLGLQVNFETREKKINEISDRSQTVIWTMHPKAWSKFQVFFFYFRVIDPDSVPDTTF